LQVLFSVTCPIKRGILLSIVTVLGTEMRHLNNKNNTIVTTTTLLSLATIILLVVGVTTVTSPLTALASRFGGQEFESVHVSGLADQRKAPVVVSGDNIYIAWWNGTAGLPDIQTDVMFRASNDGGQTFSDKINLSNTTDADSIDAEIAAEGANVIVTWWETGNQTSDIPVARISTDAGETFGPIMVLSTNGTIGIEEEEE
jgi:hypothetical protein